MKNKVLRKVLAVALSAAMLTGTSFTTAGQFIGTNVSVNAGAYMPNSTVWYDPTDVTSTSIALSGSGTFPAGAFGGYPYLTNIVISGNVELPANAFKGMKSLKSIAFTGTTTKIPTSAFQGCTGITFVNYGNVVTIGESAFNGCSAYTSLSYASKVTSVGKSAFYKCTKLASVSLPNVKTIGASAFSNCTALNKVDLGSNVTTIGDYAFNKCSKLTAITLPKTVTSIGTGAFQGCTNLMISGYAGSKAETYAWNDGKNFKYLDHTNVTSVSLQSLSVEQGKTATITATVSPSNAYKKTLKWSSNNTNVATVNGSGVVTAVGTGTATITAKSHNGQTATCQVTVTAPVLATGISLNKTSTSLQKGQSETLTATVTPSNTSNKAVTWGSNNTSVATVSGGTVTAVGAGTATITATTSNGISAACQVTVSQDVVEVTGISLNKTSASISKGSSETLTATITPSNATNKAVTWSSSNTSVATVSCGKVTAVSAGTATITATSNNGKTATCKVTVTAPVRFEWGKDNWRFTNSSTYFGNTYYINSTYYNKLMQGLNNAEKQRVIDGLKAAWGGSCYGMATVSILGSYDIIDPSVYTSGATSINEISSPPSSDVKSLINYYFALQYTDQIYQRALYAVLEDSEKAKVQKLLECLEDDTPTLFCYYWAEYNPVEQCYECAGHAIVAYDVQDISGEVNDFKYNKKVLTYDNRMTGLSNGRCIYINTNNYSWYVPDDDASSMYHDKYGDSIGFVTNNLDYINYHGYINGNDKISVGNFIASLSTLRNSPEIQWSSFDGTSSGGYNSVDDDEIKFFAPIADGDYSSKINVGFKNHYQQLND